MMKKAHTIQNNHAQNACQRENKQARVAQNQMQNHAQNQAKTYRPNVAAIILSSHYPNVCEFFLGEREDMSGVWQFPQGGIDEGEEPAEALFRELEEEIGTNEIEILAQYPQWLSYDFPPHVLEKMYPFCGQTQLYFLVQLKPQAQINLKTPHQEFVRYDFVRYDEVLRRINYFKKDIYTKVLQYFKDEGYF